MVQIIDGKALAARIRGQIKVGVQEISKTKGIVPRLSVVLIGNDPGSQVYVRNKEKACAEVGIGSEVLRLSSEVKQEQAEKTIKTLNDNKKVHGILVQLPIPKHLDEQKLINLISPEKDADGLLAINLGKLLRGENPMLLPCTPQGIIELVLSTGQEIKGKKAVVVGRSNIVGKPVALMLLERHATVTLCHSRTADLAAECRQADILVAAIGKPRMIAADMIKKGAIVIDVGMNRTEAGLVGDVDFEKAKEVAGWITPVPGGVGPMTIAMLLKNTLLAAKAAT